MDENILDLAKKLISIPSVTENVKELDKVLDLCTSELRDFKVNNYKKNKTKSLLFFNTNKLPSNFNVVLNAHIDVVAGKKNQFQPKVKNGKLYGRGAQDMKSATAAMILLFKNLAKSVKYPLGLQIVTDEETGGYNGTGYQVEQGIRTNFGIFGEPTDLGISNQAKGVLWLKVVTKGKSGHAAHHWKHKNPVLETKRIIDALEKEFPAPDGAAWITTVIPTMISTSNKTFNKIAEDCILSLDIRYTPDQKDNVLRRVKKHLPQSSQVKIVINEPPHFTADNNPYIKRLIKSGVLITGSVLPLIQDHGGSDARFFGTVNCPSITFGPIGSGLHSDDEWVEIKSLVEYYRILENFLRSI